MLLFGCLYKTVYKKCYNLLKKQEKKKRMNYDLTHQLLQNPNKQRTTFFGHVKVVLAISENL